MTTNLVPLLSVPEQRDFRRLEGVIRRGLGTFREVGAALLEIRDRRLYKATHGSFDAYCRERWAFTRGRANQLIAGSRVVEELATRVATLPTTELQARVLGTVPLEDRAAVWEEAIAGAEGTPTAEYVEEIAARALEGLDASGKARVVAAAEEAARRREEARAEREAQDAQARNFGRADALFGKLLRVLGQGGPAWAEIRRAVRRQRARLLALRGDAG